MTQKKQKMSRIKEEQRVVEQMIRLYCRKKEGNKELCPGCQELLQYAAARLERCKFGEEQAYVQEVPHPLLSPSDERTNVQSDALGWTENDSAPPGCCHQACHERIVTTGNGHEWRICK